jgi:glycosyltransferase involved in cell wall biosynthesis
MPHRNPSILIPICKKYEGKIRSKHIKFITTVEPEDDNHSVRFLNEISRHRFDDIIINVGRLSREDVVRYFTYCHALWPPTTLETLCLPYLESMAMGVPILAPDLDFARYVCGEAALFYNPWDIKSIFEKIMLIKDNASLRQELIKKGEVELGNRDKFSRDWEETASEVLGELRLLVR